MKTVICPGCNQKHQIANKVIKIYCRCGYEWKNGEWINLIISDEFNL